MNAIFSRIMIYGIVLILFFIATLKLTSETFVNYPQQIDPSTVNSSKADTEQLDELNINYKSILYFIQNNPTKSIGFIKDVHSKFCTEHIDFSKLMDNFNPVFN